MSGYCADCGNTMCACSALKQQSIADEIPEDYSNVLPFERTQTLDSVIEDAVGKAYLFGFLDENGDLQYTVGDDLEPEKLLLLLESIKMTYIYGLD